MDEHRERDHRDTGSDDRRQPGGADEFPPVVTTEHGPFCRNCGDPFSEAEGNLKFRGAVGPRWRPCPNPSPGRPLVDCGIGGHMYTLSDLPEAPTYD